MAYGELRWIGTSGPIDADGNGPQRARQASSMGIGRESAICERIEIMCKSSLCKLAGGRNLDLGR